mmetsp:Transcript_82346/g.150720  ORF Transcript_82346/g.150720 Transcript_82346/m.150720 type:complete len:211 (-) Transcript_82346:1451-2083(-)
MSGLHPSLAVVALLSLFPQALRSPMLPPYHPPCHHLLLQRLPVPQSLHLTILPRSLRRLPPHHLDERSPHRTHLGLQQPSRRNRCSSPAPGPAPGALPALLARLSSLHRNFRSHRRRRARLGASGDLRFLQLSSLAAQQVLRRPLPLMAALALLPPVPLVHLMMLPAPALPPQAAVQRRLRCHSRPSCHLGGISSRSSLWSSATYPISGP